MTTILLFILSSSLSINNVDVADLSTITPSYNTLLTILGNDFVSHVETDEAILNIASFEWSLMEENTKGPFIITVNGYRAGVLQLMNQISEIDTLPLVSKDGKTSYIVYEEAGTIMNLRSSLSSLVYAMPFSSLYKFLKYSFHNVYNDVIYEDPFECSSGIILLTVPNFSNSIDDLVMMIRSELWDGRYKIEIDRKFYWIAAPSIIYTECGNIWKNSIRDTCNFQNVEIEKEGDGIINVKNLCQLDKECILTLFAYLSTKNGIYHIENSPVISVNNINAARNTQTGNATTNSFPFWSNNIIGTGEIVTVTDGGLDTANCYFSDTVTIAPVSYLTPTSDLSIRKVVQYLLGPNAVAGDEDGHGTHVSGSAAGYNVGTTVGGNTYNGMAPGAKIAFVDIGKADGSLSVPSNISTLWIPGYDIGARISTNSWSSKSNVYATGDLTVDQFMYYRNDILVLFAGQNWSNYGKQTNTVSSQGLSKNGMQVTSAQSYYTTNNASPANFSRVSHFSPIGPTDDGRIKPDVVGSGQSLNSASSGTICGVIFKQGTSMATPHIAGAATLVRDYYLNGWYPTGTKIALNAFIPSGALIKATLINSAVAMKSFQNSGTCNTNICAFSIPSPPNIYQGWGRVVLNKVLRLNNAYFPILYVKDNIPIATNEIDVYKFTIVPKNTSQFEAFQCTLTWTDPPTATAAAVTVLNNLDLYATKDADTKNATIYPNNLIRADDKNNVEKIVIAQPTPLDVITVRVKGKSVTATATQKYAFVATGTYVPAAWYCQDPRSTRPNTLYMTENCRRACSTFSKNPICCPSDAGDYCTIAQASDSNCIGIPKPNPC